MSSQRPFMAVVTAAEVVMVSLITSVYIAREIVYCQMIVSPKVQTGQLRPFSMDAEW